MPTDEYIPFRNSSVGFTRFGNGPRTLFCFHGFGEDAQTFGVLEPPLGERYTLFAIDLPFHGKTRWQEGLLLRPDDLLLIMESILEINHRGGSSFSLLGFSMGGRVALSLLQSVPARIERAVLLAPDGLHANFWYFLGTQTRLGNALFSYTMKNPAWFFAMAKVADSIGLVNKSVFKFVHQYLDDPVVRTMLYRRWTTLRRFRPQHQLLRKAIKRYRIPVTFLFGKFDRIITGKQTGFLQDLPTATIETIEAGHHFLKQKFASVIASRFSE